MTRSKLAATVLTSACLLASAPALAPAEEPAAKPTAVRVEAKKVCMVNDALFGKDQIPVEVNGRTYYGCCEMCKERLAKDPASRTATDPVSGKAVDKATAVIAALPDGAVLYFETEANFEAFNARQRGDGDRR
jgi:YHS domain-containing protein